MKVVTYSPIKFVSEENFRKVEVFVYTRFSTTTRRLTAFQKVSAAARQQLLLSIYFLYITREEPNEVHPPNIVSVYFIN